MRGCSGSGIMYRRVRSSAPPRSGVPPVEEQVIVIGKRGLIEETTPECIWSVAGPANVVEMVWKDVYYI